MHAREATALTPNSNEGRALWMSTIAFTVCFAVWTIFSIIGVRIKDELGLSETEFGLLVGTPILTGSLARIVLGIWTDRYGGRLVFTLTMLAASVATVLLAFAHTYPADAARRPRRRPCRRIFRRRRRLRLALFPAERQGTVLGIFGVGNVGAAVTKLLRARSCSSPGAGKPWRVVWAAVLAIMAIVFWLSTADDPVLIERRKTGAAPKPYLPGIDAAQGRPRLALCALLFLRVRRASSRWPFGCRAISSASTGSTSRRPA